MCDIGKKETKFGLKDILFDGVSLSRLIIPAFLRFGAQDKGTYQQAAVQRTQGINQISPPGSIPRITYANHQRIDISLYQRHYCNISPVRYIRGSHIRKETPLSEPLFTHWSSILSVYRNKYSYYHSDNPQRQMETEKKFWSYCKFKTSVSFFRVRNSPRLYCSPKIDSLSK